MQVYKLKIKRHNKLKNTAGEYFSYYNIDGKIIIWNSNMIKIKWDKHYAIKHKDLIAEVFIIKLCGKQLKSGSEAYISIQCF